MLCLPVPIYTPLPWPGENFPQPDIGAVCPFSGNGAEMQRNTGYFPTESLEPSGNRLFSRSALNEGYLFRGSLVMMLPVFAMLTRLMIALVLAVPIGGFTLLGVHDESMLQFFQTWLQWRRNRGKLFYRG